MRTIQILFFFLPIAVASPEVQQVPHCEQAPPRPAREERNEGHAGRGGKRGVVVSKFKFKYFFLFIIHF